MRPEILATPGIKESHSTLVARALRARREKEDAGSKACAVLRLYLKVTVEDDDLPCLGNDNLVLTEMSKTRSKVNVQSRKM